MDSLKERILLITGKLAEPALRRVVDELNRSAEFDAEIVVLNITVAALMHTDWIQRKLETHAAAASVYSYNRVLLPGYCQGDLQSLSEHFRVPFERGPKDLFDLPELLGGRQREPVKLDDYNIEILAEINHAPRMSDEQILKRASRYRDSGADVIDLGCIPGESWSRTGKVTRLLRADGFRVSIDSFDRKEVESAVQAGAELVLSCNGTNRDWAAKLDATLIAIPDDPHDLSSLNDTVAALTDANCRFRIDPILEPIGFGFAASLARYFEARRRWPDVEMMMGVGNLTELTEVDTAGVNVMLAAVCQELGIHSVLTTEVINWARTAVKEFDIARRLMFHSVNNNVLPKHLHGELVQLRDPKTNTLGNDAITQLAERITDPNFRIIVDGGEIHVINRDGHWQGTDAYILFDEFTAACKPLEPSHAFYLGYELSKARTALTLGKQYVQDEALRWGWLTVPERSAHERRRTSKD